MARRRSRGHHTQSARGCNSPVIISPPMRQFDCSRWGKPPPQWPLAPFTRCNQLHAIRHTALWSARANQHIANSALSNRSRPTLMCTSEIIPYLALHHSMPVTPLSEPCTTCNAATWQWCSCPVERRHSPPRLWPHYPKPSAMSSARKRASPISPIRCSNQDWRFTR